MMIPVFSSLPSEVGEQSLLADLQILPDQELMSLWEHTQVAVFSIESRGGNARSARVYEHAVLMEIQRRHAGRAPHVLFGSAEAGERREEAQNLP